MKKLATLAIAAILSIAAPAAILAQDEAPAATEQKAEGATLEVKDSQPKAPKSGGFGQVIFGSGVVGTILWLALFVAGAASVYFIVDSIILVRPQKIMPQALIDKVIYKR